MLQEGNILAESCMKAAAVYKIRLMFENDLEIHTDVVPSDIDGHGVGINTTYKYKYYKVTLINFINSRGLASE